MARELSWSERQAREATKRARATWGAGWRHLSERQRQSEVCREIVYGIVLSQVNPSGALREVAEAAGIALGVELDDE